MSRAKCVIRGCGTSGKVARELGISFHEIPSSNIRDKWLQVINITDVRAEAKVCSMHFQEDDFKRCTKKRILKPNAVPSLFIDALPSLGDLCGSDSSKPQYISDLIFEELKKSSLLTSLNVKTNSPELPPISSFNNLQNPLINGVMSQDFQTIQVSCLNNNVMADSTILKLPEQPITFVGGPDNMKAVDGGYSEDQRETEGSMVKNVSANHAEVTTFCSYQAPGEVTEFVKLPSQLNSSPSNPPPLIPFSSLDNKEKRELQFSSSCHSQGFDHSYSISPQQSQPAESKLGSSSHKTVENIKCPSVQKCVVNSTPKEFPVDSTSIKTWPGPEAYNQAMDAQENRKMCVENRLLKRKILELNSQHKKSINELKKKSEKLNSKLQYYANSGKQKREKCRKFMNKLYQCKQDDVTRQFAKLTTDAEDTSNLKANFLLDQIKLYGSKSPCFSDTTLAVSRIWFEKGPEAYNYVKSENVLTLPCFSAMQETISFNDDSNGITQYCPKKLQEECRKLVQETKLVSLHLNIKEKGCLGLKVSQEENSAQFGRSISMENNQASSHVVAFAVAGITSNVIVPCAFYSEDILSGISLSNLVKSVIRDMEEIGFTVVRLICDHLDVIALLFEQLGMIGIPKVVHPNDPTRTLFLSYNSNGILKEILDKFILFALKDSDEVMKMNVQEVLQELWSVDAINPALHVMLHHLKNKKVTSLNVHHHVQVFSSPIIESLSELRKINPRSYFRNHEFFEMLEQWQSIENILGGTPNHRFKKLMPVNPQDNRIMWLKSNFGEYLQSVLQGKHETLILSAYKELIQALIICSSSTFLTLQHLAHLFNSQPSHFNTENELQNSASTMVANLPSASTFPKEYCNRKRKVEEKSEECVYSIDCLPADISSVSFPGSVLSVDKSQLLQDCDKSVSSQPLSIVNINSLSSSGEGKVPSKNTRILIVKTSEKAVVPKISFPVTSLQTKSIGLEAAVNSDLSSSENKLVSTERLMKQDRGISCTTQFYTVSPLVKMPLKFEYLPTTLISPMVSVENSSCGVPSSTVMPLSGSKIE